MGWIISGIAETIVSVIGDLLTFLLTCFTNFDLDIGYRNDQSFGELFTLDYYNNVSGLVDSVFPEASVFFPIFVYVAYMIVIIAMTSKIASAMLGPLGSSENPFKALGKGILAAAGVTYSYTIFIMIEMFANSIYGLFKEKFLLLTEFDLPVLNDYLLNQSSFFGDSNVLSQIAFLFLEIGLFTVLLIQFLRLLLEAFERYIVLAVLFYTCPLAFSTLALGSDDDNKIFIRWVEMIVTAFLVLMLNLFFLGVFYAGFIHVFNPSVASINLLGTGSDGYLDITADNIFSSGTEFVLKMCLLIAWLTVGQKTDEILRALGYSTAKTGSTLGTAVIGGITSSFEAAKGALNTARSIGRGYTNFKNAKAENIQNDIERQGAESILKRAGDAHDTVRASSTSSELEVAMAGKKDAMTSDIIGSDDLRPSFSDKDTRNTLSELGINAPGYGDANLVDGKASFIDSAGDTTYEVGDASRWQAPDGVASFTEEGANGFTVVHAASQEEISDAQGKMLSSLEANPNMSDGITWSAGTDEDGNANGLAIGYDKDGTAKYAATLDGVANVDTSYGGVYEYQDTQGNNMRMSGISISDSVASYSVHDLQDTEHQTKHFTDEKSFISSGVEFKRPASSPHLERKSVSMQDAHSISNSKNKVSWKSSNIQKQKEAQQAKKVLAKTNPKFESAKQKTLRSVDKIKDKAMGMVKQDKKK